MNTTLTALSKKNSEGQISDEDDDLAGLVNVSDSCPPSPDECSVLAQKVKLLEERMDRKASELMNEINKLTANDRLNTVLSQEYVNNILRENAKLKSENESLRKRAENLSYIGCIKNIGYMIQGISNATT